MLDFVVEGPSLASLDNVSNPSGTLLRLVSVSKGSRAICYFVRF